MDDSGNDTIDSLDALLEDERAALLSGELDTLHDLHDRKQALIDLLGRLDTAASAARLQDVNAKLERNQGLLESAMSGIRSVARRLATVRRVRESLEYYEEGGAKTSIDVGVERTVEKRA